MSAEELIVITWTDAHFELDEGEPREDFLVSTVGWVLSRGPRFVRIASERIPDGWRAITSIPVEVVRHCETLGVL